MSEISETEKKARENAFEVMNSVFEAYQDAVKSGDSELLKQVSEQARSMAAMVKNYHLSVANDYKNAELKQRAKEFEYKTKVTDPFEQQKAMAQIALQSRFMDLAEQGKAVGNFNLPSFKMPKEITTSSEEVNNEDIVIGVKRREDK